VSTPEGDRTQAAAESPASAAARIILAAKYGVKPLEVKKRVAKGRLVSASFRERIDAAKKAGGVPEP